jgi:malonate decarboxylase epsilon subunit
MCGTLTFAEALAVVRERGELMQSLLATGYGMLALNRLPLRQSVSLVKENSEHNDPLYVAIINRTRSDRRCWRGQRPYPSRRACRRSGPSPQRRSAIALPAHGPGHRHARHSPQADTRALTATYITNKSARAVSRSTDALDDLAQSASHTVQWADAMSLLGELRVTVAIETGPGDILTGLVQRNTPAIRAASVATTRFSDVTYFIRRGASDAATDGR